MHFQRLNAYRNRMQKIVFAGAFLYVSGYVSAIDGIISIGGKNRHASSFSNIKKDLKLSLGTGLYQYHSTRNLPSLPPNQSPAGPCNMVIYQRGNVTVHIPVKAKPILLQTFRTPTPPAIR
ncbi:MAG: hypothetical protein FJX89_02290 [Bacteroidetes bacterium]|nr:hypothetical protein [Bacteroidota bacterium]